MDTFCFLIQYFVKTFNYRKFHYEAHKDMLLLFGDYIASFGLIRISQSIIKFPLSYSNKKKTDKLTGPRILFEELPPRMIP